jgi:hypothetical protein
MTRDEQDVRALLERWAAAVHRGAMDEVLADHADDIVMFGVPPPDDGARGIDAHRQTLPTGREQSYGVKRYVNPYGSTGASTLPPLPPTVATSSPRRS